MDKNKDLKEQLKFDTEGKEYEYLRLFDGIERITRDDFHENFHENVLSSLKAKEKKKDVLFFVFTLAGSIFIILSVIMGFYYLYGKEGLQQIQTLTGWGVIIGLLVVVFQLLDKNLIHKKTMGSI